VTFSRSRFVLIAWVVFCRWGSGRAALFQENPLPVVRPATLARAVDTQERIALMNIPLVDLKAQYATIKPEIDAAIARVLEHTGFVLGREVENFEKAFADYVQVAGAVGVASGTAALQLALEACNVGRGDEVVTTAHTFFATAEAISRCGAIPVFADIDACTYNLDPNHVEDLVKQRNHGTSPGRVKALLPVHLYGRPAEMDAIMDIAARYDLRVIEDAAQAHGAEYKGRRCGSIGHMGCFSFYPGKNLGGYGDGGAVTSNDPALLDVVRRLRNHGRTTKYEHERIGMGERLDALQAAILLAKLPHLEDWTERRRGHAMLYSQNLADLPVVLPDEDAQVRHVYHLYVIRTASRDRLMAHVKSLGIASGIHYPLPLHRQPAYQALGYGDVSLPVTEKIASEIVSLPMYPELDGEKIGRVTNAVREVASSW
jgi:dTDP-4-amino-4,6-dideoxygalactose transaminase